VAFAVRPIEPQPTVLRFPASLSLSAPNAPTNPRAGAVELARVEDCRVVLADWHGTLSSLGNQRRSPIVTSGIRQLCSAC
jgi:hypothetical protein